MSPPPGRLANDRPEGRYGQLVFDVPVDPEGQLKRVLRSVLRSFPTVRAATLIEVQGGEYGESPTLTVLVSSDDPDSAAPALEALRTAVSAARRVVVRIATDDVLSRYAIERAIPFYFRDLEPLPPVLDDEGLRARLAEVPDTTSLHPMFADYPGLFEEQRNHSHRSAKEFIVDVASRQTRFTLLLRTFGTDAVEGPSTLVDDNTWIASLSRPIEKTVSELTPLQLLAISNPRDPIGSPYSHQLQLDDRWFDIAVALIARASMIFVICDSTTSGITDELLAIQQLDREDSCCLIVPGDDFASHYAVLHFGHVDPPENRSNDAAGFRRQLVTFGTTTTTRELSEAHAKLRLRSIRPRAHRPSRVR